MTYIGHPDSINGWDFTQEIVNRFTVQAISLLSHFALKIKVLLIVFSPLFVLCAIFFGYYILDGTKLEIIDFVYLQKFLYI